jgi:hypothetical protein
MLTLVPKIVTLTLTFRVVEYLCSLRSLNKDCWQPCQENEQGGVISRFARHKFGAENTGTPWEVITTCASGIEGFWFAVIRYVHAAQQESNHASIGKHATAKRPGGHVDQLSAIGQLYEST